MKYLNKHPSIRAGVFTAALLMGFGIIIGLITNNFTPEYWKTICKSSVASGLLVTLFYHIVSVILRDVYDHKTKR